MAARAASLTAAGEGQPLALHCQNEMGSMFTQILSEQHGEGQALALRRRGAVFRLRNPPSTVARGPVRRERPVDRSMARDRPSPYAEEGAVFRLRNPPVTVARGTGPRERPVNRSMARDRPSPYAEEGAVFRLRNPPGTGARGTGPRERMENSLPVMNLA